MTDSMADLLTVLSLAPEFRDYPAILRTIRQISKLARSERKLFAPR